MANPLTNPTYRTRKPPQREPLTPITEEYAPGDWHPYRGVEDHGVESIDKNVEMPDYRGERPVEYPVEKVSPDPVPVRVVNESARERREWTTITTPLSNAPAMIVNRRENRTSMTITNVGVTDVLIAADANTLPALAYKLAAGKDLTLNAETEVYAWVPVIGEGAVAIVEQFTVKL